ncbi:MAG: class I SAM-dependent methyltransferase [Dehalococcoidia bacterium]|nr:class I SAM-dependent methyltransferase [Dehalococcoidia bacterium]
MALQEAMNILEEFARIAPLYDLDYGDFDDDIDIYLNFAQRTGSPVVELGVGTGRLALALADAGYRVVGIDQSKEMLDICRAKLPGSGAHLVELALGDIREFKIDEKFNLAICAANSFGHLLSRSDQRAALGCTKALLAADGLLLLDVDNPERRLAVEREGEIVLEWIKTSPKTGKKVMKLVSSYFEHPKQLQHFTFIYDEVDNTGAVSRTIASFALRYNFRAELELLLESEGYLVEAVYGGYFLEEFDQDSDRIIVIARPKSL